MEKASLPPYFVFKNKNSNRIEDAFDFIRYEGFQPVTFLGEFPAKNGMYFLWIIEKGLFFKKYELVEAHISKKGKNLSAGLMGLETRFFPSSRLQELADTISFDLKNPYKESKSTYNERYDDYRRFLAGEPKTKNKIVGGYNPATEAINLPPNKNEFEMQNTASLVFGAVKVFTSEPWAGKKEAPIGLIEKTAYANIENIFPNMLHPLELCERDLKHMFTS